MQYSFWVFSRHKSGNLEYIMMYAILCFISQQILSSSCVVCEHAFAGVKRYGAVSQIYRNRIPDFDDSLMLTASGLGNFYLMACLNSNLVSKPNFNLLSLSFISQQVY